MIVIDKLCYNSRLRYENASEKFAFAVITLCICVMSRSIAVACIVLAVTGILTVCKGGVPVLRYVKFLTAPLAFLLLSTIAIMFHISRTPLDLFACILLHVFRTNLYFCLDRNILLGIDFTILNFRIVRSIGHSKYRCIASHNYALI